jgi:hypothetical protein
MNSKATKAVVSSYIITSFAQSYGASRAAYDASGIELIVSHLEPSARA